MSECNGCVYAERLSRVEKDLDEIKQLHRDECAKNSGQHKEFYDAIGDIRLSLKETESNIKMTRNEMGQMFEFIKIMQKDITALKEKPSKKMDAVMIAVTSGTLMTIITIIVNSIVNR